jgi:predicted tellurium resistance membrane protein TerC
MMMEWLFDPYAWVALATLTALEIVLGIDNIIFISILSGKLPLEQQAKARNLGLILAMGTRILLLLSLVWIMKLTTPLFSVFGNEISGRSLILIFGGLFLMGKSTLEIHEKLEGDSEQTTTGNTISFGKVIVQIMLLDIVFSLDSVITAVGMVQQIEIMITAVILAVGFMLFAAGAISNFVERHPTVKMLALSFLLLIGMTLVGEGLNFHIPKGYVYFAMAFSVMVEMLNLRVRGHQSAPVKLRKPYTE